MQNDQLSFSIATSIRETTYMSGQLNALEEKGAALFEKIGLPVSWNLSDVPLLELNPHGAHGKGDHLEVDYLIPFGDVCLVGEITERAVGDCQKKLKTFRQHINAIGSALNGANTFALRKRLWTLLGVSSAHLERFRGVRRIVAFVILTKVEQSELELEVKSENRVILFRYDWELMLEYSETIGEWAKNTFLDIFGLKLPTRSPSRPLQFGATSGDLLAICDRFVTSDRREKAHVITFIASPYEILPVAKVCRRDALPSLAAGSSRRYQRTLYKDKLVDIRTKLLNNCSFLFPNGVLAILSESCSFDPSTNVLEIHDAYGSINIVDGQHRLFSYADKKVEREVGSEAKIVITAVVFECADREYIETLSARLFVEINTNQTRVISMHLYGIGYDLLGNTAPKYLAAHILGIVNSRSNRNPMRGILKTVDSPRGRIKMMEIVGSLGVLTSLEKMKKLSTGTSVSLTRRRTGVENLFDANVADLASADVLIRQGAICIERYFRNVARIFRHDWPNRSSGSESAFTLTKFFSAFVRLLRQFVDEAANWEIVDVELEKICDNVLKLRKLKSYDDVLFQQSDSKIPDATARISDMFRFLNENRVAPTAFSEIMEIR